MANESQFIRGAGMLAVLKVLEGGELYGYAIVEALAKTKGDALHLGQATVYPMLYNLEAKGLVKARWDESGPRPRKYYALTKAGKTRLADDTEEWSAITRAMASLGLERAGFARLRLAMAVIAVCLAWIAPTETASAAVFGRLPQSESQSQSQAQPDEGAPRTAAEAYKRLAARIRALRSEGIEIDEVSDDFVRTGFASAEEERWLAAVRPLARELVAAGALPHGRDLDYSQGFALPLPHVSDLRFLQRAMRILAVDSALRGDRALASEILRAQVASSRHVGADGLIISSLVSGAMMRLNMTSVEELVDRGALDAAAAAALLGARKGLADSMRAQMTAAIGREADVMVTEIRRIADLTDAERHDWMQQLGLQIGGPLDAVAMQAAKDGAAEYHAAVEAAIANPDPAAMRAAFLEIEQRAASGGFGELMQALAPAVSRALEVMGEICAAIVAQDALLADIAAGRKTPEDLVNAAYLYMAAARAAQSLDAETQMTIEALRLAPERMTDEDGRVARRAIEALRPRLLEPLRAAAKASRCSFKGMWSGVDIMPATIAGSLGALRIALFEPLLAGKRPEGASTTVDACVATLVAVRHFADGGGIGAALIAQRVSRDLAAVLARLDADGALDDAARARIAAEIERFHAMDPLGLRRAIDLERAAVADIHGRRSEGTAFGEERLRRLSADSVMFLVSVLTEERPELAAAPCACPFDGPLLDVRGLIDLEALTQAQSQKQALRARLDALYDGQDGGETALQSLKVSRPLDMETRIGESLADFDRLRAFGEAKRRK